ncbi:helix-turn-helix domain-containing protein [Enterococcus sp. JM9B]|nr:helix-turn-helix transcriptional regulator [Enterococcus sp. JM9B]KAF1300840.1 hypothetical protein BAU16_11675 [Enterococcus sp. JM9B]
MLRIRLKEVTDKKGYSLTELANHTGISKTELEKWYATGEFDEHGIRICDLDNLVLFLDVSMKKLIPDTHKKIA